MNDPASYNNENDFGLDGRVRDVAPDIMTSEGGKNRCLGCPCRVGEKYCSNPLRLNEQYKEKE